MSKRLTIRLVLSLTLLAALGLAGYRCLGTPGGSQVPLPLRLNMSHPRFDESPAGYTSLLPSDTYTASRGFGWSLGVGAFDTNTWPDDRLDLDSLHRDAHLGLNTEEEQGPSFRIEVPAGSYRLKVITGAAVHGVHAIGFRVNGKEALDLQEIVPDGEPREFVLEVEPVDGRIEIAPFTEDGTEWLISALELVKRGAPY